MGRLLLIYRLVVGDIKRRPVQSALLAVVIVITATTLTLGLGLRNVAQKPFAHTRAATRGPDIVIQGQPNRGARGTPARAFRPLAHATGVAAIGGPFPLAFARLTAPGIDVPVNAEGRTSTPTAVNQPLVTAGRWVRPGGVVIEQGLAGALGLHVGDRIRLRGRAFRVVGIALQTEQAFYPACTPGLVWVTPGDAGRLATPSDPLGYEVDVKLRHPSAARAFWSTAAANAFSKAASGSTISQSWEAIKSEDYRVVTIDQKALLIGSWLLALLAIASVAIVVGGRMTEQTRRVGLLKAVGATPRLVAVVLLAQNLLLALAGAAAGLLVGWLLVPSFSDPGRGLLGTPPSPTLTLVSMVEVICAAMVMAVAATLIPAARAARTSTIRALNDPARPPKRRPRLIAISSRLPVPLLLGLRLGSHRPRRTVLTTASLAIAVTMIVAAVTLQHEVDLKEQTSSQSGLFISSSIGGRVTHLVWTLGAVLVVLAGVNAIFTMWTTVIDGERPTALARVLGATPRQVSAGLTAAQLLPGLVAACIGIPAGLGLYELAGGHVATAKPPIMLLLAMVPCTLIAVAVLTYFPARAGARRSVADVLRSE
ncbi:MAG: FtsX-like permease family protein [Solirubrobacterales bacterium]|nr:FtsX-like permease family protein [Solirubrobacterales bacterium]